MQGRPLGSLTATMVGQGKMHHAVQSLAGVYGHYGRQVRTDHAGQGLGALSSHYGKAGEEAPWRSGP